MKTLREARKERLAQREPRGPARGVVPGNNTVYDILQDIKDTLDTPTVSKDDLIKLDRVTRVLNVKYADFVNDLENFLDGFSIPGDKDKLLVDRGYVELKKNLDGMQEQITELASTSFEDLSIDTEFASTELSKVMNEIKQVALDNRAGGTSPIDLGDWLY